MMYSKCKDSHQYANISCVVQKVNVNLIISILNEEYRAYLQNLLHIRDTHIATKQSYI